MNCIEANDRGVMPGDGGRRMPIRIQKEVVRSSDVATLTVLNGDSCTQ